MCYLAEHIIGLTPHERTTNDGASVRQRWEAIREEGLLRSRGFPREMGQDGTTFTLDHLAGDGDYVFLSRGVRYRANREASTCYGFVFDATALVANGALVGPDLLNDYEEILDEVVKEIEATLPPLEPANEEELAAFADGDPALLAHLRAESTSRYWDIMGAIENDDMGVPGADVAKVIFLRRVLAIQHAKRKSGDEALALLATGDADLEILVPFLLPLANATALIVAGEVIPQ